MIENTNAPSNAFNLLFKNDWVLVFDYKGQNFIFTLEGYEMIIKTRIAEGDNDVAIAVVERHWLNFTDEAPMLLDIMAEGFAELLLNKLSDL